MLSVRTTVLKTPSFVNRFSLLETIDSEPVPGDTIRNIQSPSITLRVTLVGKKLNREISAHALLDSGAEGIIIDQDFATGNKLTLRNLVHPLPVKNVDGMLNKRGSIKHTTIQRIRIKTPDGHFHEETAELYVMTLADHDIIFGTDWLCAHNPEVDWTLPQVSFTRCPKECTLSQTPLIITSRKAQTRATTINTIQPSTPEEDASEPSYTYEVFTAFEETLSGHKYYVSVQASTTTSTQIATHNMSKSTVTIIPEQFCHYAKVFSEEASRRLPKHQPWDHAIDLVPGATIKKCGIYHLTPKELQALCEWLADQLAKGYIRLSKSPMPVLMFFVKKKGSDLRPVQDCCALNDITVKNTVPIPLIPELIDRLRGVCYFTKFDIHVGYNNIHIKEGNKYKAAFRTPLGLFEPLVMTFGLCNAPATFQMFMNHIFQDMVDEGHIVVYLDDILIFANNLVLLDKLTHEVLSQLDKFDLYLKPKKCSFAQTTIDYLGLVISEGQITMDPAKVKGITEWPTPTSVKQVQAFLGFCNLYRHFIHNHSTMARPLFDLTKKESPFLWGAAQEAAFRTLIHAFTTAPVLALPDHSKPFRLITDASDFATGTILEQPDTLNHWHPVAFHSKSLQPPERNYKIHDKEPLKNTTKKSPKV
jgi:hypothetical protein